MITGVGYNYRFAPLVRHAAELIGAAASVRSRTTAAASCRCTAATSSALLSWRFMQDEAGYGVTSDLLSHAVDLAHFWSARSRGSSACVRR